MLSEIAIRVLAGLGSVLSMSLPLLGLWAIFFLAQTWQQPEVPRSWTLRYVQRVSRYYVFAVLIVASLWLFAAVLVINTDFWTLYEPAVDPDPVPALEKVIEHWEQVEVPLPELED